MPHSFTTPAELFVAERQVAHDLNLRPRRRRPGVVRRLVGAAARRVLALVRLGRPPPRA